MLISLTTRDTLGQQRHLTARFKILEEGLEAINAIVISGGTLLRVHLLEGTHVLALPIEAFDGKPILMHQVENEWTQILGTSVTASPVARQYIEGWMHWQREEHETYIGRLETAITGLNQRLMDAEERFVEPVQSRLISQLTKNRERYESILEVALGRRSLIATHLSRLQNQDPTAL